VRGYTIGKQSDGIDQMKFFNFFITFLPSSTNACTFGTILRYFVTVAVSEETLVLKGTLVQGLGFRVSEFWDPRFRVWQ
jgi:hypothetical protein